MRLFAKKTSSQQQLSQTGASCSSSSSSPFEEPAMQATARAGIHIATGSAQEEEHPGSNRIKPLKIIRVVQVFCSLLFIITIVAVLANFGPIVRSIFHSVRQHYERLQAAKIAAGLPAGSELVQKLGQDKADSVASTILSTIAICLGSTLGLAVPSLAMDIVWLVFTASPRARARSCGGNRLPCLRYTCDMSWDTVFTFAWAINLALCGVSVVFYRGPAVSLAAALSVIMFVLKIATAVLSGVVRRRMRKAAAAGDNVGSKGVGWVEMGQPGATAVGFGPATISASIL